MSNSDQAATLGANARPPIPALAYLLTGCIAVIGSNSLVLGPIAPAVAVSFATSVPVVMMAAAAFGLGTSASALFLARYIDRVGARRMLQAALLLLTLALVASAVAPTVTALVAAQLLTGIAAGVAMPAIYASSAAIAPPGRESGTIGVVLTGWTLSMVAGVSLSAVLADLVHWRAVFAAVALLAALALGSLTASSLPDVRKAGPAPAPLEALGIPGIVPLLIACGAFMTAFYGVYGYLGDHLHSGLGQPVSANGLAALAYGAGFGTAALFDGIIDRLGARRVMPFAYLLVAIVYVAIAATSNSYGMMLAMVAAWGLANHFGLNVLVMRLSALDPSRRGTIMGLNSAVTYLAVFVGTTGFGPLYSDFGFAASAMVAALLMLVAASAAAWRTRQPHRT
ncbi:MULTISPECIES: MFS transporter [unclassified Mesorhizobium]|uniref:MFS transporter n=1 Tax=unclassified Mesorhizobium TaxID=325217 RepID=UPI00112DE24D|nr:MULTISPECIES: MFS transporter [unclassified Mesorhizobium]MBZ9703439.1 MFS transporter [Mesorhizobium sp. CO1-1-3]MBZ9948349.1 MFS transporter [Mesorhizobium sp. BR1-1-11]MBZ9957249.1 MFS transporter [Mesorhizobium sp. BR1-1-14]TPJ09385.1 MFS transporter [Mesorhizobium sp. B2-8-1]TPL55987.1 MFS transporter [Mesorhizobium sp. B2-4-4]